MSILTELNRLAEKKTGQKTNASTLKGALSHCVDNGVLHSEDSCECGDHTNYATKEELQVLDAKIPDISNLVEKDITDNLQNQINALGEPFRIKQWATNALNVSIEPCASNVGNTSLNKMIFTIDAEEGKDYQIVGMLAYELFDAASGGNRINAWPVCQFTGNGQKELSVRWTCMGTETKVAKRINAWVLLKHR